MKLTIATLVLASCAMTAQAHQVWLEQDTQGATLYFGEYGDNLREASPGLLDKFVKPVGRKLSAKGAEPLPLSKTATGFVLAGRAARGESLVAEEPAYPISERRQGDAVTRSLYVPAARLVTDLSKQEPALTLDLVPTGQGSQGSAQVQAFYKGKPLPKAKVSVVTASGWAREYHADDAGRLTVNLPWQGTYVLELAHTDTAGGERGAEKWDRATYVTSLTLVRAEGLPALPAPQPAAPNPAD
ncbi:DUF4198 domain-containing protein [Eleftheria terrae]|uniref:DUF4198 domain-containing protein n=1 Tax=Eleftheria terrae TaxID=1597781 RepID=UPI00263BB478|nr:DUF4198 domain-containing protein [Eleftheria terrae]WKB55604.1 DUF4198 domain-containing protein [Eleftheria terrae]